MKENNILRRRAIGFRTREQSRRYIMKFASRQVFRFAVQDAITHGYCAAVSENSNHTFTRDYKTSSSLRILTETRRENVLQKFLSANSSIYVFRSN